MVKMLLRRGLRSFSRRYAYDTGYMEALLDHSLTVFLKYSTLNVLSAHRRGIPAPPWWAARIRAALWEDCGPCVQLVCNMAVEAGVDPAHIAATVAADFAALDDDMVLALRFTECVLARDPDADQLRAQVQQRWGEAGLVSLAMTISTTRVYPSVKYVLGHGHACMRVNIAERSVAPVTFQSATMPHSAIAGATS